jgi:hypothetical protein
MNEEIEKQIWVVMKSRLSVTVLSANDSKIKLLLRQHHY